MNLIEVFNTFPTQADCIRHIEQVRWGDEPQCPYCEARNATAVPKELRHHCNSCNTSFSVTVGTIFHHTHIPLQKWFLAISIILNAKKGVASRQLARDLGVNKNTAWRIAMKVREAMSENWQRELLQGVVEVDETYVGGKPRKGAEGKSRRGRGTKKTPVVGAVSRDGKVRAVVVKRVDSFTLSRIVKAAVDRSATVVTDEFAGYCRIKETHAHETVCHKTEWVRGDFHTNTLEGFWGLLKRGIIGQYHQVSRHYLNRYVAEFCFRYNYRNHEDIFALTLRRGLGAV